MRILPALVPLFAATALVAWALSPAPLPPAESFDAGVWRAREATLMESGDPGCVRGGMAADLIRRESLLAKSATDVVGLLGSPRTEDGAWHYPLGQCGPMWTHNDPRLTFDAGSRVRAASWR